MSNDIDWAVIMNVHQQNQVIKPVHVLLISGENIKLEVLDAIAGGVHFWRKKTYLVHQTIV